MNELNRMIEENPDFSKFTKVYEIRKECFKRQCAKAAEKIEQECGFERAWEFSRIMDRFEWFQCENKYLDELVEKIINNEQKK